MSPERTRRRLIQTLGSGVVAGLAGCITAGGPEPEPTFRPVEDDEPNTGTATGEVDRDGTANGQRTERSKTYDFEVRNTLTESNFEASQELSEPKPAVIDLRVTNLDPDDEKTYFDRTVKTGVGETRTLPEAFTVTSGRTIYAINVKLEPFVERETTETGVLQEDFTFSAGGDQMPTRNPILVVVGSDDREEEELYPFVSLDPFKRSACERRDFCNPEED